MTLQHGLYFEDFETGYKVTTNGRTISAAMC